MEESDCEYDYEYEYNNDTDDTDTTDNTDNTTNTTDTTNTIDNTNSYITFIIPSIGRDTLSFSIESLLKQNNPKWKCIVIFDGIEKNIAIKDERIQYFEIEKTKGVINQASDVRNYGIQKANTEWIAFLDDDDTITDDYVEIFYQEQKIFDFDIYIFRMLMDKRIIPAYDCFDIKAADVGISFVCHRKIFDIISFENSHTEDFDFLNKASIKKCKIIISNTIKYFVKKNICDIEFKNDLKINDLPLYNKIFINCLNPYLFYSLLQEIV